MIIVNLIKLEGGTVFNVVFVIMSVSFDFRLVSDMDLKVLFLFGFGGGSSGF